MTVHCKYDELVNPKSLKNHPKNRNKHGQDQIDRLAELYQYHGIRHPIIVSKLSGFIVAGHGRKLAAIRAGVTEMPVVYQDFENTDAEYAFIQADNAIALWAELDLSGINSDLADLGPDFDLNMLGIKDFKLDLLEKELDGDPDEVPEKVEPKAKLGEIYKLGNHRLMCGDSTSKDDIDILMGGEPIESVFTDPPYGIKVVKASGKIGGDKAFGSVGPKKGGLVKAGTYMPIAGDESIEAAELSYKLLLDYEPKQMCFWGANYYCNSLEPNKKWIVWNKNVTGDLFSKCELAWTNLEGKIEEFVHTWNGLIKGSEHGQKRVHPTQKPVALAEWFLTKFCKDSKNVVDLFGGSGSTLIACEKTDKHCFMMELEPHYIDVIIARWEKLTGKKAELLNGNA